MKIFDGQGLIREFVKNSYKTEVINNTKPKRNASNSKVINNKPKLSKHNHMPWMKPETIMNNIDDGELY